VQSDEVSTLCDGCVGSLSRTCSQRTSFGRWPMRINVSVHKNTKQWDKMEKNLLRGADKVVRVGWWDSRHPSGVPTAQVAAWNEEGHMNGGIFSGTYTPP